MQRHESASMGANREPGNGSLGVACVGLAGAVATTMVAGAELIRQGACGTEGLPLSAFSKDEVPALGELASYEDMVFGGWDLSSDDLASAALSHGVLDAPRMEAVKPAMSQMKPWPAVGNEKFCRNADGDNLVALPDHASAVAEIRRNLRDFAENNGFARTVLVNLASTERVTDPRLPVFASPEAFERGVEADDPEIGPSMLYAYAAILEGVPYVNFTPSVGAEVPALVSLAEERGVPLAGRDGKTGQTMLKTVLAPALRSRALHVDGWFSTNLLGNKDGFILDDSDSLASKVDTKGSVLDEMLGYEVDDHIVKINYYKPRGDNKEAWDNVDLTGFLGQRMQLKVNFLCGDSVLAAPLVMELARLADLAKRRGEGGVQEQFGLFFKAPMTRNGSKPEHAFHRQETTLLDWLANGSRNGS